MKRAVLFLIVAGLAAGCTGTPTEPEAVDDCNGLAKIGAALVADYLTVIEGVSLDVVRGDEPPPAAIAALNSTGAELDARAATLGCDAAELNAAIVERTAELASVDPAGMLFLDLVRAGSFPAVTVP